MFCGGLCVSVRVCLIVRMAVCVPQWLWVCLQVGLASGQPVERTGRGACICVAMAVWVCVAVCWQIRGTASRQLDEHETSFCVSIVCA